MILNMFSAFLFCKIVPEKYFPATIFQFLLHCTKLFIRKDQKRIKEKLKVWKLIPCLSICCPAVSPLIPTRGNLGFIYFWGWARNIICATCPSSRKAFPTDEIYHCFFLGILTNETRIVYRESIVGSNTMFCFLQKTKTHDITWG